jgi:hypothetical protein
MFAPEDRPYVSFSPFFALFPHADVRLNSFRPRPTASSPSGAGTSRGPRIGHDNRYSPATLSLLSLPNEPAPQRQELLSPVRPRTISTHTHDASKPFRMRTYTEMGEGVVSRLNRHAKIRRGSKLLGMIFLHKQWNNCFGMIFFHKNRGVGVPSRITSKSGQR